jgi:hypothetical protein
MQAAAQAGKANLNLAQDVATLTFTDYYKPRDNVALVFDPVAKRLNNVNTYLDEPKKTLSP